MPNVYLDDDERAYDREAKAADQLCDACLKPASEVGVLTAGSCAACAARALPAGFRALTAAEGERLEVGMSVLIFDRAEQSITRWVVLGYRDGMGWRVAQGSRDGGDTFWLDDDNPNFWADDEQREQRGPQTVNGAFVAVVPIDAEDLTPLLRESLYPVVAREVLDDARLLRIVR